MVTKCSPQLSVNAKTWVRIVAKKTNGRDEPICAFGKITNPCSHYRGLVFWLSAGTGHSQIWSPENKTWFWHCSVFIFSPVLQSVVAISKGADLTSELLRALTRDLPSGLGVGSLHSFLPLEAKAICLVFFFCINISFCSSPSHFIYLLMGQGPHSSQTKSCWSRVA